MVPQESPLVTKLLVSFTVEYCAHAWLNSALLREDDKRADKNMTVITTNDISMTTPLSGSRFCVTHPIPRFDADSQSAQKGNVRSESLILQDLQTHGTLANSVGNYRTIVFLVGGNGDFAKNQWVYCLRRAHRTERVLVPNPTTTVYYSWWTEPEGTGLLIRFRTAVGRCNITDSVYGGTCSTSRVLVKLIQIIGYKMNKYRKRRRRDQLVFTVSAKQDSNGAKVCLIYQ